MDHKAKAGESRRFLLANETCPYCGETLTAAMRTKEHLIGRRFVPKGTLDGNWNLWLNACRTCNGLKSSLEDDISAISMQPTAGGQEVCSDDLFTAEAARKATGSISRRTRKRVIDSRETAEIETELMPGVSMKATVISQPQVESERLFQLALLHTAGLFYFLTYDERRRVGGSWPGGFFPLIHSFRADWGNAVQRCFMKTVAPWQPRLLADTAESFFKVAIRKHPSAACWSWAYEWNKSIRVVGLCGDETTARTVGESLPSLHRDVIRSNESCWAVRSEVALVPVDDCLFAWPFTS